MLTQLSYLMNIALKKEKQGQSQITEEASLNPDRISRKRDKKNSQEKYKSPVFALTKLVLKMVNESES